MGRLVQPEDSLVAELEARVKQRAAAEVGVLIGKWSVGSKDVLLAIAATPPQDGVSPVEVAQSGAASKPTNSKKPSGPTFTVRLDQDWIAEHANQVNRMLPGGLSILGVYLLSPEGAFTAAAGQLASVAAAIRSDAAALVGLPSDTLSSSSGGGTGTSASSSPGVEVPEDMLLLHVDSTTARLSTKVCTTTSPAAATALKPCELKPGKVGSNLVKLTCSYTVTLNGAAKAQQELQQVLQTAADREAARMAAAAAVVDGNLYYPGTAANSSSSSSGSDAAGGSRVIGDCVAGDSAAIQLYVAPTCCIPDAPTTTTSSSSSSGGGSFALQGAVEAVAFVFRRDPVVKAIAEVKADISKSLRVRCELLCDEAASAAEEAAAAVEEEVAAGAGSSSSRKGAKGPAHPLLLTAGSNKAAAVALPRRVLLPFAAGTQVCDYLFSSPGADTAEEHTEACQHAAELLSLPGLQPAQVVDLEGPARRSSSGPAGKVAAKGVAAGGSGGAGSSSSGGGAACNGAVLAGAAAAAVAALAVVAAMLYG